MRSWWIGSALAAATLSSAGLVAAQEAEGPLDKNPDWVRQPSAKQYIEAWPTEAYRRGLDGRAVLTCEVSTEGGLRRCKVMEETPAGMGFGPAALNLSSAFRMTPGIRDGRPVVTTVTVPIAFRTPSMGGKLGTHVNNASERQVSVMVRPTFIAAPLRAEVEAAYPEKARAAPVVGAATLECVARADGSLQNCKVKAEEPRGQGFGAAARSLSDRFRLRPLPEGATGTLDGVLVRVPFQFDPPGRASSDVGGARVVATPTFSSMPPADRFEASFPAAARAAGVKTGRSTVSCAIGVGGKLADCSVVSEEPQGMNFGQAALTMVGGFAMTPWTEDGKPVDGTRIRVPLRFILPEEAAAASTR
jgi:TonB family protein